MKIPRYKIKGEVGAVYTSKIGTVNKGRSKVKVIAFGCTYVSQKDVENILKIRESTDYTTSKVYKVKTTFNGLMYMKGNHFKEHCSNCYPRNTHLEKIFETHSYYGHDLGYVTTGNFRKMLDMFLTRKFVNEIE